MRRERHNERRDVFLENKERNGTMGRGEGGDEKLTIKLGFGVEGKKNLVKRSNRKEDGGGGGGEIMIY